jgi:hypothetical protein
VKGDCSNEKKNISKSIGSEPGRGGFSIWKDKRRAAAVFL